MDSQRDACNIYACTKQAEEIVSSSLLPQEWEMEYVKNFFDPRFAFMDSKWLPAHHNGIPSESKQQDSETEDVFNPTVPPQSSKRARLSLSLRKQKDNEDGSVLKDSTNITR